MFCGAYFKFCVIFYLKNILDTILQNINVKNFNQISDGKQAKCKVTLAVIRQGTEQFQS